MVQEITPKALKARLDAGEAIPIIDIRESWELEQSRLDGAIHIPMNDIPDSLDQIPTDKPVVLMCHLGQRSAFVADWMNGRGYDKVYSLAGGIDAWADEVDPSVIVS